MSLSANSNETPNALQRGGGPSRLQSAGLVAAVAESLAFHFAPDETKALPPEI
jgi:hypothetical protein